MLIQPEREWEIEMESTPTAFAVLDILGYGRLMAKEPEAVLALVEELLKSSVMKSCIQHENDQFARYSGADARPKIEYLQFSDTLIIYLREEKTGPPQLSTPSQLVESVCYATSLTLAHFIASGIPLRGAVGFGQTFISRDPLFFTGAELYETFKLEREQVWAGAALHNSAKEALGGDRDCVFFTRYQVPMKHQCDSSPDMAIDWVSCLNCGMNIVPPWETMFLGGGKKVQQKSEETLRFYKFMASKPHLVQVGVSRETVESMKSRLSRVVE